MKKSIFFAVIVLLIASACSKTAETGAAETVASPDGRLVVSVQCNGGRPTYSVAYDGVEFLQPSPMGLNTNVGDFTSGLQLLEASAPVEVTDEYDLGTIKRSHVKYDAVQRSFTFGRDGKAAWTVEFNVDNNNIAYRYALLPQDKETLCAVVNSEATGFNLPAQATAYLCPQMPPMGGWKRTAPSYETKYDLDVPLGKNPQGPSYVFPALFRNGADGWILISETGLDGSYCASHLLNNGSTLFTVAFPPEAELNGVGGSGPAVSLPSFTPWRTITVGRDLKPIVETTIPWDVVKPKYLPSKDFEPTRGTWSWIIRGDDSCNFDEQIEYIDFAADMGYETVLVDALWDDSMGNDGIEELARYAASKGVKLYLWYNSNGTWNDAPQGPRHRMNRVRERRNEMEWMKSIGIAGIKVDFFGGDKQPMMQLYEDILSDANDFGLQVIFHGCTLPRGWERMYPNFASAEAVLASENLNFRQEMCDAEARDACIHPFVRNTVASMDFGGSTLNKYYNRENAPGGSERRTSDVFALATAILFQSPVQHFALAPNNLTDAPAWAVDFMKAVPTTWDDTRFITGEPGKYVVMERRHGADRYIAGINAGPDSVEQTLADLPDGEARLYLDGACKPVALSASAPLAVNIPANGGFVLAIKDAE